jgi:DNA anti-recombination protein RmuC
MKRIYEYLSNVYNEMLNFSGIINRLNKRIEVLEKSYQDALLDNDRLKEENNEIFNLLSKLQNNIDAVDARIDILYGEEQ